MGKTQYLRSVTANRTPQWRGHRALGLNQAALFSSFPSRQWDWSLRAALSNRDLDIDGLAPLAVNSLSCS